MWRVGAPRRPSATSCIVRPEPRLRGRFPEFLDCFSLKQLRKHLGLFDPLGRENKYLEGRNFCGIFLKSKGLCVALAQVPDVSMAGGPGDRIIGGFFSCSSRGAPGQRDWDHLGREFLPCENEEKEEISWIKH